MPDLARFDVWLAVVPAAIILAVLSSRLSSVIRIPAPALFLAVAALVTAFYPQAGDVPRALDEQIVTVALIFVLFDGGMHIGWRRFRRSAAAITWLGVAGTAVTAAAIAVAAHLLLGVGWATGLLVGAALAPTDPAVVFSVLGRREIAGRTGTILEGESGANDPVGIALLVSLLAATGTGMSAVWSGLEIFADQMLIGAAVGIAGGLALSAFSRRVSLPNESLYLVRTIACSVFIYGVGALLGGSGFLAVFLAGILAGDTVAPYQREIERFSSGVASLAEIVVFSVLGLTVSLSEVVSPSVLWPGMALAALLVFVIRPVLVGVLSLPLRLRWGERAFVLWAGLKGAVPILLGLFIVSAHVSGASRIYAIIFVVVLVSVVLQGALVPSLARAFRVPMRLVEPEPWAAGMRLAAEPEGLHRHTVAHGSAADGRTIGELHLTAGAWVSMIRRDGRLVQITETTQLRAGDTILLLAGSDERLDELFGERGSAPSSGHSDVPD
jgi:cell volume regulation protein A